MSQEEKSISIRQTCLMLPKASVGPHKQGLKKILVLAYRKPWLTFGKLLELFEWIKNRMRHG